MDMYEIKTYLIIDIKSLDLFLLGDLTPTPRLGNIFVAHPKFHKNYLYLFTEINSPESNNKISFINWYKKFLELPENTKFEFPVWYPQLSEKAQTKINKIAPLDNIVILIPEANSFKTKKKHIWKTIIKDNKKFKTLTVVHDKENKIKGVRNLDLDLYDTVAIMLVCHNVYSIRNGLCDLVANKISNMTILYINSFFKDVYTLKNVNESIIEHVVEDYEITENTPYSVALSVL